MRPRLLWQSWQGKIGVARASYHYVPSLLICMLSGSPPPPQFVFDCCPSLQLSWAWVEFGHHRSLSTLAGPCLQTTCPSIVAVAPCTFCSSVSIGVIAPLFRYDPKFSKKQSSVSIGVIAPLFRYLNFCACAFRVRVVYVISPESTWFHPDVRVVGLSVVLRANLR